MTDDVTTPDAGDSPEPDNGPEGIADAADVAAAAQGPAPEAGAPEAGVGLADRELADRPNPGPSGEVSPGRTLGLLADVQVELTVELGKSRIPMRELMALEPGAVFELDRPAEAAVDVLVNGTVIARGEVVVVDGDFGVRITEITGQN